MRTGPQLVEGQFAGGLPSGRKLGKGPTVVWPKRRTEWGWCRQRSPSYPIRQPLGLWAPLPSERLSPGSLADKISSAGETTTNRAMSSLLFPSST